MTEFNPRLEMAQVAPGDAPESESEAGILGYVIGLVLASGLTAISFYITRGSLFWPPSIPTALIVLAIAQMGIHLVFFLHMTSGPDSTNNVLALAFGILIVFLIIAGSLWIMANLNHHMLPMEQIMKMQR
jgi:cytochrome o ubiquinol oxidase operon protein cyoD